MISGVDLGQWHQTFVNVNLSALVHNLKALRRMTGASARIMAVVKADAYGHGAIRVAETLLENGASFLAVARISEAVELRDAGIAAPILLFGDLLPCQVDYMIRNDIRATVISLAMARTLAMEAVGLGGTLKVHIKVDTGMGRLGIVADPLSIVPVPGEDSILIQDQIQAICGLNGLEVEGIYTHFANADCLDKAHALGQVSLFTNLLDRLESQGIRPFLCHMANSAAILEIPQAHLDMVRAGISLYGLWPSHEVDHARVDLKPVMSITSTIIHLKRVPERFAVSYGSTHMTPRETFLAAVPIGYADGYSRKLSSRGEMIVKGIKVPVVGRVCMDLTMIDVGSVPGVKVGDEVTILGREGKEEVSADDIARLCETINYEVVASLTRRMPIRYTH